ncbi:MAG: hypothetical protein IKU30_03685 [Clostridia bacterium]|nr:hypothetical protein [Clostridia bacterium]
MKNKTLAIITASIITAAALILTASLSLLNGAAIDISDALVSTAEPVIDNGIADDNVEIEVNVEDTNDVEIDNDVDEEIYVETEEDVTVENEAPAYEYPVFDYVEGDARNVYVCGGEHVDKGVVIDVYSHKTGKLVGQLAFTSQEITSYISSLMREEFKPENELWIEEKVSCVALPEGDYRIEVYAGTWFSYTYGTSGIFELTQCTLTFSGGEKLTGYIDFLIADLIADIEAGNVEAPNPEMAVSKLIYA